MRHGLAPIEKSHHEVTLPVHSVYCPVLCHGKNSIPISDLELTRIWIELMCLTELEPVFAISPLQTRSRSFCVDMRCSVVWSSEWLSRIWWRWSRSPGWSAMGIQCYNHHSRDKSEERGVNPRAKIPSFTNLWLSVSPVHAILAGGCVNTQPFLLGGGGEGAMPAFLQFRGSYRMEKPVKRGKNLTSFLQLGYVWDYECHTLKHKKCYPVMVGHVGSFPKFFNNCCINL
jgi:hypothetical protein